MNLATGEGERPGNSGISRFGVLRVLLSFLLLAAAGLKAWQLATGPVANNSLFANRWLLIASVEMELGLGIWLLTGIFKRQAWHVSLACFMVFACISGYKGFSGEGSCGCFGRVSVPPWYTFAVDIGAVGGLLACRPRYKSWPHRPSQMSRLAWALAIWVVVGTASAAVMASYKAFDLAAIGRIPEMQRMVLLEPRTWIGKPFPLLAHVNISERLRSGGWVVLLYHHDCPDCAKAIPGYQREAIRLLAQVQDRVAFVAVSPSESATTPDDRFWCWGSLDQSHEWLGTTPMVVRLRDGVVLKAWEGEAPLLSDAIAP